MTAAIGAEALGAAGGAEGAAAGGGSAAAAGRTAASSAPRSAPSASAPVGTARSSAGRSGTRPRTRAQLRGGAAGGAAGGAGSHKPSIKRKLQNAGKKTGKAKGKAAVGLVTGRDHRPRARAFHGRTLLLAEFITCAVIVALSPLTDKHKSDPPQSLMKRNTAVAALFLVLALISAGGKGASRVAAAFGGLVTVALLVSERDLFVVIARRFNGPSPEGPAGPDPALIGGGGEAGAGNADLPGLGIPGGAGPGGSIQIPGLPPIPGLGPI